MKRISVLMLILVFFSGMTALAQKKAVISFVKAEYDYGKIKELEGSKACTFNFVNKGDDTLRIQDVKLSCGCTTSEWTRTPVAPGGKGFVKVTYDPKNRPGPFAKGIDVLSNDPDNPRLTLVIKGDVEPRPRTIADDYPNAIGNLRFSTGQLVFQNIPNDEKRTDTIKIYNEWTKPMTLTMDQLPVHMSCKAIPETLKPNQKGILLISYDAKMKNDFGFVWDRFFINTNDTLSPQKQMAVSANIIEDFSKLTPEQLANAPKIVFETPTYDFGTVMEGTSVTWDYKFTNTGKDDLYIRKVKGG